MKLFLTEKSKKFATLGILFTAIGLLCSYPLASAFWEAQGGKVDALFLGAGFFIFSISAVTLIFLAKVYAGETRWKV